jgi:hypothetical protein
LDGNLSFLCHNTIIGPLCKENFIFFLFFYQKHLTNARQMVYIWDMETTKSITMTQEMADRIQELADRERRSFAREAQVLLEAALERQKRGGNK